MDEYQFHCAECGQQVSVNDGMRESILEFGCPVCSADVSPDRFSALEG